MVRSKFEVLPATLRLPVDVDSEFDSTEDCDPPSSSRCSRSSHDDGWIDEDHYTNPDGPVDSFK